MEAAPVLRSSSDSTAFLRRDPPRFIFTPFTRPNRFSSISTAPPSSPIQTRPLAQTRASSHSRALVSSLKIGFLRRSTIGSLQYEQVHFGSWELVLGVVLA